MADRYPPTDLQTLRVDYQRRAVQFASEAERVDRPELAEHLRYISNRFAEMARLVRVLQVQDGELDPIVNTPGRRRREQRRR